MENFLDFLSEIATSDCLLNESSSVLNSQILDKGYLIFKSEELKTAEEWCLVGKLPQQEKEKLLSCEKKQEWFIKWYGTKISGKVYYSLEKLELVKNESLKEIRTETWHEIKKI